MSKRKKLLIDENTELATKVKEVEEIISEPLTIWTNDDEWIAYQSVADLPLEERRLFIVYSLLDCSVCMSFYCNLIYIIIIGKFSIFMIGYILLLSWSAPLINSIFTLGKNLFLKLINTIANKFDL